MVTQFGIKLVKLVQSLGLACFISCSRCLSDVSYGPLHGVCSVKEAGDPFSPVLAALFSKIHALPEKPDAATYDSADNPSEGG